MKKERQPLTRRRILKAALVMIDAEGVEAFSTRKLGKVLGCEAMSIYHHFPSKSDLLDEVAESLLAEMTLPTASSEMDWIEQLRQIAHEYRKIAKLHPKAFVLLAVRKFNTKGSFRFLETLLTICQAQGYSPAQSLTMIRILGYFINGATLSELAQAESEYTPSVLYEALEAEGFNSVLSVLPIIQPQTLNEIFETGLTWLLEAIQRMPCPPQGDEHRP